VDFHTGDKVVHWAYGTGEILNLEEKHLSGQTTQCYVVQIGDLMLWVPINGGDKSSLRALTSPEEFDELFEILASPAEPLSEDRLERKNHLMAEMREGTLRGICRVIRDLHNHRRTSKMNDGDNVILERAQNFLLNEWQLALSVPYAQADKELKRIIGEYQSKK
jgi:RNA polymerase-interacting CarD/CdnL/TRCF family regulator